MLEKLKDLNIKQLEALIYTEGIRKEGHLMVSVREVYKHLRRDKNLRINKKDTKNLLQGLEDKFFVYGEKGKYGLMEDMEDKMSELLEALKVAKKKYEK